MMKKTKLFTLGGIILLSLGSLTGCVEPDDEEVKDDNVPSDTGSGDPTDTSEDTSAPFTVTLNGLQSLYRPTDTISFSDVSLTLTYDDLTTVNLSAVEYDVETRASEDTEFILYTDGLYNAVTTGDTVAEKTYSLSYLIYLEEEVSDEEGKTSTEVVTYSGVPTNQQSIVITSNPSQIYSVYSFNAPDLQVTYEKNITESVSEEGGSENEDKFFVEPDYYEVGDDNPFIYQPSVYLFNRATLQFEFPDNFPMDFTVSHYDSEKQEDETLNLEENDYVSLSGYSFQFTEKAVGEVFTISASLSDFTTDMVGNPIPDQTFTVKVEDGWNVYDALDLGRMNLVSDTFDDDNISTALDTTNYYNKGRDFFASGSPRGYETYPNHYWVDSDGKPIFVDDELATDPNVTPTDGDHVEYSLTRDPRYDVEAENYEDESFSYRVYLDEYWKEFLTEKGKTDLHQINGVFLHTDITITEDSIPDILKTSNEEAYALGPDSADGLVSWGAEVAAALGPLLHVSEDGTDYQYDDMDGAIRDRASIYLHHMEDDFTFNGNLFTVNASNLKWSMNNVFMADMNFYYTKDTNFAVQGNASLFEFDYNREATHPDYNSRTGSSALYDEVPLTTVKNLRYQGNSMGITQSDIGNTREGREITNAEFASGSLSFIKSQSAQTKVDNVICTDANIAYWSQQVHSNDELYGIEVTNSKTYDCYTTAFYIWCGGNVKTSNSEYKRFGGPLSICISTYEGSGGIRGGDLFPHDYTDAALDTEANDGSYSTSYGTTVLWDSNLIVGENVVTESLCGGTEAWFALNNATSVVTQVKSYDYLLNEAGKTMVNDEGKMNLKSLFMDSTYILSGSYGLHGSYVSSEDNAWGSYTIDDGAETDMQKYIDEYAKWYTNTTDGVTTAAAGPLIFTNTGNVFGFPDYESAVALADPANTEAQLYDLKQYEANSSNKVAAQFSKDDTEMFMVLPLQTELDGIEVDLVQIVWDMMDIDSIIDQAIVDILGSFLAGLLGDSLRPIVDPYVEEAIEDILIDLGYPNPHNTNLGDVMRINIDQDITLSVEALGYTISFTMHVTAVVGMGDTLIGVVMDLYDYDGQA